MFRAKKGYLPTYRVSLAKGQIYRALGIYMNKVLEPYQLTPPDWNLLGILYEKPNVRSVELAQYLSVKPPVVTIALNRLIKLKIIKKTPHSEDSRASYINLTPKGKELVEKIEAQMQNDFKQYISGIKSSDVQVYFKVLDQLSKKLNPEGDKLI